MSAAELLDEPQGAAEIEDMAQSCASMWAQALLWYWRDARTAWKRKTTYRGGDDGGEALEDLVSKDRPLLANLLEMAQSDMSAYRLGDLMLDGLEAGR